MVQKLDLSGNNFARNIPIELGRLNGIIQTPATYVTIPEVFVFLHTFYLPLNSYSLMWDDLNLHNIIASWMDLTDTVVNWKGSLRSLERKNLHIYAYLDLSNNQLSGKIPAALGDLQDLKLLDLSYNKLEGEIPASFGRLIKLESLDLSHNRLNGSIPQAFVNPNQLATIDVSSNELTGQIPIGGQMYMMINSSSYANNSGLCGFQIGVPCGFSPATGQVSECGKEAKDMRRLTWGGMLSGYPFGLFLAVILSYIGGWWIFPSSSSATSPAQPTQPSERCTSDV